MFYSLLRNCVLTLTVIVLFSASLQAQKQTFTGYYISTAGDTVQGVFTDYKQWNLNPNKVGFIPAGTGKAITLTPLGSIAFHVATFDTYLSYCGRRMTNPLENPGQIDDSYPPDTYDSVCTFLRQIALTEDYVFYTFKDNIRLNLFYAGKDKQVVELLQKVSLQNNNLYESMQYKQQLKVLLGDKNNLAELDKLVYNDEYLAGYINKLNKGGRYYTTVKKASDGLVAMAGVSLNSFEFTGDKTAFFSRVKYGSSIAPLVSLGYIATLGRNFGKVFLFPQLSIYSYKHSGQIPFSSSSSGIVYYTFKATAIVALAMQAGYNVVNKENLKVFIAPGAGVSAFVNNKVIESVPYGSSQQIGEVKMASLSFVIKANAGVTFKNKYVLMATYAVPSTTTNFVYAEGRLSSVQLSVGYKF